MGVKSKSKYNWKLNEELEKEPMREKIHREGLNGNLQ